jgi:hypothetical protein
MTFYCDRANRHTRVWRDEALRRLAVSFHTPSVPESARPAVSVVARIFRLLAVTVLACPGFTPYWSKTC